MNFRIGRDSEEEQLELGRISNQEGFRRGAQGAELGRTFELGAILKRSGGS